MVYTKNDYFINPYAFIEIPKENPKRKSVERGEKTGFIECSIEITEDSPVFIPNTTKYFDTGITDHYFYEFYSYDDLSGKDKSELKEPAEPVIPGSEIRGMVRNIYEQLTNSCFLEVDENNLPYKRTPLPKKAALMKYDGKNWVLYYNVDDEEKIKSIDTKRLFCEDSFIAIDGRTENEWFTGLKFNGIDSEKKPLYIYEKDRRDRNQPKYKIGETAYLQIDGHSRIKSISKERVNGFVNHEITIKKKSTLKAKTKKSDNGKYRETIAYEYSGTNYKWGDVIFAKTAKSGIVEDFAKPPKTVPGCDKDESGTPVKYMLHMVPMMGTKKYFSLYRDDTTGLQSLTLNNEAVDRFENVIKSYIDDKVNIIGKNEDKIKFYKQYYEMFKSGKKTLLVYIDNSKTYISPSCMTKEYFVNKISDILKNQSEHDKCMDINKLCPACRLFGMIGKLGSNSGRVRVCDTHYFDKETIKFESETVLPILGTPRISATEFYLQKPDKNALMWNYDYWVEQYESKKEKKDLITHPYMPSLAGRKVYWHGKLFEDDGSRNNMNMRCTVRPINKGIFKFKVYFEDLSECEFNNLIFCLNLNDEKECMHKIGKGKPIGMGSIKVTVDKIYYAIYSFDEKENKITANYVKKEIPKPDFSQNIFAEQILCYTKPMPDDKADYIAYPLPKRNQRDRDEPKIFEWFSKNRGISVQTPTIIKRLPSIASVDSDKIFITKSPDISDRDCVSESSNNYSSEATVQRKLFELLESAKKNDEKVNRPFTANEINTAFTNYNNIMKKAERPHNKAILQNFVNTIKESDPDYLQWKNLLEKIKKRL
jgi:CRISPR-associated protein (TIGR03986 family)